ncbi:MAG: tRNA lysidine(34) synthetase TilS [Acidobacteria bacterium]|nr:tRNA lysidine(34) synthetase TilS [Acidobacteriota bacterium]
MGANSSTAVRSAIRSTLTFASAGDQILVGVSGGADSLALAAGLFLEAVEKVLKPIAVIIDHGLQDNSETVSNNARLELEKIGYKDIRIIKIKVEVTDGIEASARRSRYEAFNKLALELNAKVFLLGHTKDDQAETVLLGLARGSGTRSLSGMAHVNGVFVRPLLSISRSQTVAACAEWKLIPWQDPHNSNEKFTRVRVREKVLPNMEKEIGPGVADALVRSARLLRDDADALDEWAANEFSKFNPTDFDIAELAELPKAVRTRILRMAIYALGAPAGSLSAEHIDPVEALISAWHGQGVCSLPGGVKVARISGRLSLLREA